MTGTVLLTGASGQLGRAVYKSAPPGTRLIAVDRSDLDLADSDAVDAMVERHRPTLVMNCAAYTSVDRAETEPQTARRVNVDAVRTLAAATARIGGRMLHVSTDFVFGGLTRGPRRPHDTTEPESVYGATKRDGEIALLQVLGDCGLVIRTAWLYDAHGSNFVKTMLRLMRERESVSVVADQVGTPTRAATLAQVLWNAARTPVASGVLHWTDAGVASWYDFAVAIQEEAVMRGLLKRAVPVLPIRAAEFPSLARRPAYSVLDTWDTTAQLGIAPRHWRTELREVMDDLSEEPDAHE